MSFYIYLYISGNFNHKNFSVGEKMGNFYKALGMISNWFFFKFALIYIPTCRVVSASFSKPFPQIE